MIITFLFINLIVYGQQKNYNDWFDMNLKCNPKSIKEIGSFPYDDYLNIEYEGLFQKGINSMFFIDEFHFDSLGQICKTYYKNITDSTGLWSDYSSRRYFYYPDSIITIDYFPNGIEKWKEKKYLDKKGYLIKRVVDFPDSDTLKIKRNEENRIIESYRHSVGTDSQFIEVKNFEYNSHGNIKIEKRYIKRFGAIYDEPSVSNTITQYEYIYDSNGNWIFRTSVVDEKLSILTQRIINY